MKPVKRLGVLKYTFYFYSGMVRPTGQETIAIEKRVYYTHRSPKKGMSPTAGGHVGKNQVWSEAGGGETVGKSFAVVLEGRSGRGRVSRLRMGWSEQFQ